MRGKDKYIPSSLVVIVSRHCSVPTGYLKCELQKNYERSTWTAYLVGREKYFITLMTSFTQMKLYTAPQWAQRYVERLDLSQSTRHPKEMKSKRKQRTSKTICGHSGSGWITIDLNKKTSEIRRLFCCWGSSSSSYTKISGCDLNARYEPW